MKVKVPFFVAVMALLGAPVAQASAPLASLLIHRSDLRPGYTRNLAPGYMHTPQESNWHPSTAALARHGYLLSFAAQFDDAGSHPQPMIVRARVQETADTYRLPTGARWGYRGMIAGQPPQSRHVRLPRVGDESISFFAVLPESPGKAITIIFRQGSYVVAIEGEGTAARPATVLAMARLVDQRIQRQG